MASENSSHLRVVDERFIKHEDQLDFLSFVVRDESNSDELVKFVFIRLVVRSSQEVVEAIEIINHDRPALAESITQHIISSRRAE